MIFGSRRRARSGGIGILATLIVATVPLRLHAAAIDYDIVYVRAPRHGDHQNSLWPDTVRPLTPEAGSVLMLLHPDGSEELLFPRPEDAALVDAPIDRGAAVDPNVAFDGQRVVFAYYHDRVDVNQQRGAGSAESSLSRLGADIFVIDLTTRVAQRLTDQALTPNTGNGADFDCTRQYTNCPQVGIFNTGPAWLADDRIVFTSSRNNFVPPQAFNTGQRTLQLFVMDADGRNVQQIGYLNQAMALHPYQLQDGRIAFSSWEGQGLRDLRQFPLWVIRPDGTEWMSLSGYSEKTTVHHFMTQMRNGDIVVTRYYNLNNNGFGDLIRYPIDPAGADFLPIDGPLAGDYPLERKDIVRLTPFTTPEDFPAPCPGQEDNPYNSATNPTCAPAQRRGKFTHPAAAPNDDLLVVYSPGPCNHNGVWSSLDQPYYDGGIYIIPGGQPISDPSQLQLVKNDPTYNEEWPRPAVPYARVHGIEKPAILPPLHNDGHEEDLQPGTPFGLIGTSSLIWRDTQPGSGPPWLEASPFNYTHEFLYDWVAQGSDAGLYSDDDIYAVRILAMEPLTDRSYPNNGINFGNVGTERLRILGEIPVRKPGDPQIMHPDGVMRADTSFLAKVPADTPITFQTLDRNAMVLNMAQTWHQVRPGEGRYDCGGCHAHSKEPLDFHSTAAGQPGFVPVDLTESTPLIAHDANDQPIVAQHNARSVDVEYFRDVQPILQRRCISCHSGGGAAGQLDLNADGTLISGWPGTYFRLVRDSNARFGIAPAEGTWFEPQLTRYIRGFQSRQSLVIWKVWGARLDGRTNATRDTDLDFTSTPSHPAGVGVVGMTTDEKLMLARWIDLGAPIELAADRGYFEDDLRPTLALEPSIDDGRASGVLTHFQVGAYDLESGLDPSSLWLSLDVPVGALPAGTNVASSSTLIDGGVIDVVLPASVSLTGRDVTVRVTVRDHAGHQTEIDRVYTAALASSPTATPAATRTPTATVARSITGHIQYYSNAAPVSAATVALLGSTPANLSTDAFGAFAFGDLTAGDWQIQPQKLGGMNTAVSALDAVYVLQAAVGSRVLSAMQQLACDVTGNGTLSGLDASLILQYNVGLITRFPVAERCGSDWAFVPTAGGGNAQLIAPQITAGSCEPGAIAYQPLSANALNQSFDAMTFGDCTGNWQPPAGGGGTSAGDVVATPLRAGQWRYAKSGRVWLPLYIDTTSSAVSGEVGYDPTVLRLVGVRRLAAARRALMVVNGHEAGRLRIALASATPLRSKRAMLAVEFRRAAGARSM